VGEKLDKFKEIKVDLPDTLLEKVEGYIEKNGSNKKEFIQNAVQNYLQFKKRQKIKKKLKEGYPKVSQLNQELADEGVEYDSMIMDTYEEILKGLAEHG